MGHTFFMFLFALPIRMFLNILLVSLFCLGPLVPLTGLNDLWAGASLNGHDYSFFSLQYFGGFFPYFFKYSTIFIIFITALSSLL